MRDLPDEVAKVSRVWKLGLVRDMMDDYEAHCAAAIDYWGSGGEEILCDVIQLAEDLQGLDPLTKAAALLHMHGYSYDDIELVLRTERSALALVYDAAVYVTHTEADKARALAARS